MAERSIPVLLVCALQALAACRGGAELGLAAGLRPGEPPLDAPLLVTADLALNRGRYVRPALEHEAVVLVEGLHGATLDLRGVELWASETLAPPDRRRGRAIVLRGCSEVRVLGGTLRGYHDGLVLENCRDVLIEGLVVDGFHAQRLHGTSAAPDARDALELDVMRAETWLERYGAAVALFDCTRVTVRGLRARDGQNGILIARSDGCRVLDSDLSYLSGWGAALRRAEGCTVAGNRFDACARGYVAGRYGQPFDSAGILLVGPAGGNVIASNSAVDCGIGALVIELAGASGAAPDLWYDNDFRRAFGVGLELRGVGGARVISNDLGGGEGAGLRARDVEGLVLHGNRIVNAVGPALSIVDGRECYISANVLTGSERGLELLRSAGAGERASGGHWLVGNQLAANLQDLVLERTSELVFARNSYSQAAATAHLEELVGLGSLAASPQEVWNRLRGADGSSPSGRAWQVSLRPLPAEPHPAQLALDGFEAPAYARPAPAAANAALVLGPFGPWDPKSGTPAPEPIAPGGLLGEIEWNAVWFHWDAASDPRGDLDAWRARRFVPVARARVRGWSDPWGGDERRTVVGTERFGLIATADFALEEGGHFLLDMISEDGVRVLIDERVVAEDWTWHAERRELVEVELEAGRHEIRLEYFQVSGAAALTLGLDRRPGS